MIALERLGLAATVLDAILKCSFPSSFACAFGEAEARRKAPCQYAKYARSGRVADAVRGHSFCASPTRSDAAALERPALPFFVPLTPARWQAMNLAGQFSVRYGCGVAVPSGTVRNQRQNSQVIDIYVFLPLVPWFQRGASRDARACVSAGPCAYMCARKARTSEPPYIIYVNQMDRSSEVGSVRFSPEPALRGAGRGDGIAAISIKLVGGYAPAALDQPLRGLVRSRAGERFGVFGLGARGDRARCSSSTRRGRNGGFLPFFARRSARVGTSMLERQRQGVGNACFSGAARLPSGKAHPRAPGGRGTPPCPLRRATPPTGRWRCRLTEFGSASPARISGMMPALEKSARGLFRQTGSGVEARLARNPAKNPGRGSGDAAGTLRRNSCMGGGY